MNKNENTHIFKTNKITFVLLKSCILILLISFNNAYSFTKSNLEKLSDSELILKAIDSGNADKIEFGGSKALDPTVPSYKKDLANREELIEALVNATKAKTLTKSNLEKPYDSGSNTDVTEPIEISADSVMMDEREGFSTFAGDAIVTQGSLLLKADLIEMYSNNKKVNKVIAKGSKDKRAYYKQDQPNQSRFVEATAITITYLLDKQYIYLNGDANFVQGFDSFSAGTLEYDIDKDKVIAEKSKQIPGKDEPVKRVKFKISF